MAVKGGKKSSRGGVIIKKYEIVEGGHHGGAWKVAYADFVTAMMAFFLLMWLLNATTEDQRKGLADYFSPNNIMSHGSSGVGEPFGGHTAADEGALVSDRGAVQVTVGKLPVVERTEDGDDPVSTEYHRARTGEGVGQGPMIEDQDADDETTARSAGQPGVRRPFGPGGPADTAAQGHTNLNRDAVTADDGTAPARLEQSAAEKAAAAQAQADQAQAEQARVEQVRQEKATFRSAADQIRQAVQADPALAGLAKQLSIDMTPEGLRIQIMDEIKLPMFPSGSAALNERARLLMLKVLPVLMRLKQPISISGHTDASPYPGPDRSNWELSADRANATRRLLTDGGFPEERIKSVIGNADRDPLLPADPLAAENRRIAILVLREAPLQGASSRTYGGTPLPQLGSPQQGSPQQGSPQQGAPRPGAAPSVPAPLNAVRLRSVVAQPASFQSGQIQPGALPGLPRR